MSRRAEVPGEVILTVGSSMVPTTGRDGATILHWGSSLSIGPEAWGVAPIVIGPRDGTSVSPRLPGSAD